MKPVGPLFKWFGSKWSAAKLYPPPMYPTIAEPYAGGAGYSLRHHDRHVVLWDTDPHLQVLWPWLIDEATPQLVRDIPIGVPEGTDIRTLGLSAGQAYLLKHWQRTNTRGNCWTISKWGHLPGQWTANTRARVADEVGAVRHWCWTRPRVIPEVTWFIDPPYQYNYRYGSASFDYAHLSAYVYALPEPHQVIACEAVCPKTGAIPDYLPFGPFARRVTSRRAAGNHTHSSELLYHGGAL